MAENLDAMKCGGWGVFIAPTTKMAVGEGFCRMAHRTLSGAPATSPSRWVPTVGALTCGATRQFGGAPDSHYSLSGAPSTSALTSACSRALLIIVHLLHTTVGAVSRYSALHTGQSVATPDSPVNYSGVAPQIPEDSELEGIHPGAPGTVRWCTGHCPVAHRTVRCARPGQPSVVFCSFYLNPFLDFLLVCVEPLAPIELII
jgi:hypothetical protein